MEGYIGEIRMFGGNYAPLGWAFCAGQTVQINGYNALFSILGTIYGGDGKNTFALPNLCGRTPVGVNTTNPTLTANFLGMKSGAETQTINTLQMPAHVHMLAGTLSLVAAPGAMNSAGSVSSPQNSYPGTLTNTYGANADTAMGPGVFNVSVGPANAVSAGGSQAHENRQPFIGMNYIICVEGNYPPHP